MNLTNQIHESDTFLRRKRLLS